jgi:hypothetical protein
MFGMTEIGEDFDHPAQDLASFPTHQNLITTKNTEDDMRRTRSKSGMATKNVSLNMISLVGNR